MTTARSSELYGEALRGSPMNLRHADGRCVALAVPRWLGAARGADLALLDRTAGPALDVGCGPGRLVAALAARAVPCLGIDPDPEAVRLTREAGGVALQRSVFDPLPGDGRWSTVLLADGNIGIGGDPTRLLRRCAALLRPQGQVVLELATPGGTVGGTAVRLETADGRLGDWFPWARVPSSVVQTLCEEAGLRLVEQWSCIEHDGGAAARVRRFAVAVRDRALS